MANAKDIPDESFGSGLLRKAVDAIKKRRKEEEDLLKSLDEEQPRKATGNSQEDAKNYFGYKRKNRA